jgi:hypothetical protein
MPIKMSSLTQSLQNMILGQKLGNVFYVDGTGGDDNNTGADWDHAMASLLQTEKKMQNANHDYILAAGAETATAALALTKSDSHIIGIGANGPLARGFRYTRVATVDGIQLSTAADRVEIAGIQFTEPATDAILVDDAGATDFWFHDCTVLGSTTASDAIRLDLEGARAVVTDNIFLLCKLAIDLVGAESVAQRNYIQDVDTAAKGIVVGATAHRSIIGGFGLQDGNIINLSGTTGDVGITITSSADNCLVGHNQIDDGCSDAIADSGTATMLIGNITGGITGTSGASCQLFTE